MTLKFPYRRILTTSEEFFQPPPWYSKPEEGRNYEVISWTWQRRLENGEWEDFNPVAEYEQRIAMQMAEATSRAGKTAP